MTHTITADEKLMKQLIDGLRTYIILKDDKNYVCGDIIIFQNIIDRDELKMEIVLLEVEIPGLKNGYIVAGIKEKEN